MKLKEIKAVIRVDKDGSRARIPARTFCTEFDCLQQRKQSLADFDAIANNWIAQQGGIESLDISKADKAYLFITDETPYYIFGGAQ